MQDKRESKAKAIKLVGIFRKDLRLVITPPVKEEILENDLPTPVLPYKVREDFVNNPGLTLDTNQEYVDVECDPIQRYRDCGYKP